MYEIEDIPVVKVIPSKVVLSKKEYQKKYYDEHRVKKLKAGNKRYLENREEILESRKKYQAENKISIKATKHKYYTENCDIFKSKRKEYCLINKDKIKADRRNDYLKNKEAVNVKQKEYYKKNTEASLKYARIIRYSVSSSEKQFLKIPPSDLPSFVDNIITVCCKKCGIRFSPNYDQISSRIQAYSKTNLGESNFYCSDSCKNSCDIYRFKPGIQIDPRSRQYVEKGENKIARNCQNKALKDLQCSENNGQSYCERCGDFIEVELHHTLPVAQYGKDSINSAGHILLCVGCHTALHSECAGVL